MDVSQVGDSTAAGRAITSAELTEFLRGRVSRMIGVTPEEVDPTAPLASIGVDSVHAMELVAELEEWLGTHVPDHLAWSYPTIALISEQLATETPA
ncbi:acyl carrier protein [Kribbella catacumbae]|uniref:acyl carrier protein n=1 Tax=Kribbella catacumbae TaxID=460086 RepID=UPI00036D206C|nr:acyl carrier protein [Kribbella catacumbae]